MSNEIDSSQGFYRDSVEVLIKLSYFDPRRRAIEEMAEFDPMHVLEVANSSNNESENPSMPFERGQYLRENFSSVFTTLLDSPLSVHERYPEVTKMPFFKPEKSLRQILNEYQDFERYPQSSEGPTSWQVYKELRELIVKQMDIVSNGIELTDVEKLRIADLDLPTRVVNAILQSFNPVQGYIEAINEGAPIKPKISTLGTLSAHTEEEVLKIRNIGKPSTRELKRVLRQYGLSFAG